MSDPRDRIRALWCRQLSGEELSESESRQLIDALRDDPDVLTELGDDATSHALLLSLNDTVQTEDEFVQAVMQKVAADHDSPSGVEHSMPLVPVNEPDPVSSSECEPQGLPVLADTRTHRITRRDQKRRRSQLWIPFLLTSVLFLTVGLIFQGRSQTEVAETKPPPQELRVEQEPRRSLQDGRPDPENETSVAATDAMSPPVRDPAGDADNTHPESEINNAAPAQSTHGNKMAGVDSPNMPEETLPTPGAQAFATLTRTENPVWERQDSTGSRMGDEAVRLYGGTIELTFDDGAVVTLVGPVSFRPRKAGLVELHRGKLSAVVPQPAIGFTVITPTSEVVDLGTEFDVAVKDTGASDVVLRKGEVEVAPSSRTGREILKWKLAPGGLNHASFYAAPSTGKPGPIVAKAHGARGQFQGVISIDGTTAKFQSEETFDNVHERVMAQEQNSPDNLTRQWRAFVESMQGQMRGSMNFNGRQMQFGNLEEVMRLHSQLRSQLNFDAGTPFTGSINMNGRVIQFQTREEFEAARRSAFGAAADFGAGDVLDRQLRP